jgi:hypothetical protein
MPYTTHRLVFAHRIDPDFAIGYSTPDWRCRYAGTPYHTMDYNPDMPSHVLMREQMEDSGMVVYVVPVTHPEAFAGCRS